MPESAAKPVANPLHCFAVLCEQARQLVWAVWGMLRYTQGLSMGCEKHSLQESFVTLAWYHNSPQQSELSAATYGVWSANELMV